MVTVPFPAASGTGARAPQTGEIHFWIPGQPDDSFWSWDPDRDPGQYPTGLGHGLLELFKRFVSRGLRVSLGLNIPPSADTVVAHLESFYDWLNPGLIEPAVQYFEAATRFVERIVVIRGDIPTEWSLALPNAIEVVPNRTRIQGPGQVWVPLLPQRGLRKRDGWRRGEVRTVGIFAYDENVPQEYRSRAWQAEVEGLGLSVVERIFYPGSGVKPNWHDFSDVDVLLCARHDVRNLGMDRKPPTKLINAWVAGAIPLLGANEVGSIALGRPDIDCLVASSPKATIESLALLRDPSVVSRLERGGLERAEEFSLDNVLNEWLELLLPDMTTPSRARQRLPTSRNMATAASSAEVAEITDFQSRLREQGEVARLVEEVGVDGLPELLQVATQLPDAKVGLAILEASWQRQPLALPIMAAFLHIGMRVPVDELGIWSARLRVLGWTSLCPLMAVAKDGMRPEEERMEAARAAWQLFFDSAARELLGRLEGDMPDPVPPRFTSSRPEIAAQVPVGARKVLDVGCAAGRLGASIKSRQPAEVTGIEPDSTAARFAAEVLDAVYNECLDARVLDQLAGQFDAIVAADVFGHLADRRSVVRSLSRLLRPGGVIVMGVPGLAGPTSTDVGDGWDHHPEHALDRTNHGVFTREAAEQLLSDAGLTVESVAVIRDARLPHVADQSDEPDTDPVLETPSPRGLDRSHLHDLAPLQFLLTARKRELCADRGAPEVWDCVVFTDELDSLEARLVELNGIADHLVVAEIQIDGTGFEDPVFSANRDRFSGSNTKIHHVVAQCSPDMTPVQRETTQSDAVLQVVSAAHPNDLVLLCDTPDLVSRDSLPRILEATSAGPVCLEVARSGGPCTRSVSTKVRHPVALRARDLPVSLAALRSGYPAFPLVAASGPIET